MRIDFLALMSKQCSDTVNLACSISNPRAKNGVVGLQDIVNVARILGNLKVYERVVFAPTLDSPIHVLFDGRVISKPGSLDRIKYFDALKELATVLDVNCYFDGSETDRLFYKIDKSLNVVETCSLS